MYLTQTVHRMLQMHPDRLATIFGDRRNSWSTFADRVARLAGGLQRIGMSEGDFVAMLALNSDRYLEFLVAAPWGGGAVNPCNTRWSAAEILYSLEDSGSRILIVDDAYLPLVDHLMSGSSPLETVIYAGDGDVPDGMVGFEDLIAQGPAINDAFRNGDDILGLFYTGGTTGKPKGVIITHRSYISSSLSLGFVDSLTPGGRYLHAAPMFHLADIGLAGHHWLVGNTHCFLPRFAPAAMIELIEAEQITETTLVPTMVQMLVDDPAIRDGHDLSSLRHIFYGGSCITEAVIERACVALPKVKLVQGYGMSELSPVATLLGPEWHRPENFMRGKHRSAGQPSVCAEVKIVDANDDEVPRGERGEVIVRGPMIMKGYWNLPELTANTLRGGWMHTGDVGYFDEDGFLYIVDRVKDIIISGGENIYSAEVENALSQHPAVQACAVIGIPSERWGESVHAFVILKDGAIGTEADLIAHCKTLIAGYKCPRTLELVDELPLSGAGKVLKLQLRENYAARTHEAAQ